MGLSTKGVLVIVSFSTLRIITFSSSLFSGSVTLVLLIGLLSLKESSILLSALSLSSVYSLTFIEILSGFSSFTVVSSVALISFLIITEIFSDSSFLDS